MIDEASRIQRVGTTGVYSREFDAMIESLDQVKSVVNNTSIRSKDLDELKELATQLSNNVTASTSQLEDVYNLEEIVGQRVSLGEQALKKFKNRTNNLHQQASELKENATRLQEANVQGALNVTQQMFAQSRQAQLTAERTTSFLEDAERTRNRTALLIAKNTLFVNEAQDKNKEKLGDLNAKLDRVRETMPGLNLRMCGANVTDCSDVCGGAGCNTCGGLSCDAGAVTKANQALDVARNQAAKIKSHKDEAEHLLRDVSFSKN